MITEAIAAESVPVIPAPHFRMRYSAAAEEQGLD